MGEFRVKTHVKEKQRDRGAQHSYGELLTSECLKGIFFPELLTELNHNSKSLKPPKDGSRKIDTERGRKESDN